MGQDISRSIGPPPLTLTDCLVNGQIDTVRYTYYRRRIDDMQNSNYIISNITSKKRRIDALPTTRKLNAKRSVKRHKLFIRDDNGQLSELTSKDSHWYQLYVQSSPRNTRLAKHFRRRFRLPYANYIALADDVEHDELFERWTGKDATGKEPSNIKLLVLGALRYLGRAWTLDDIEESNGISREVNRVFINKFMEYGSKVLYKKWVIDPAINTHVSSQEKVFRMAGFNGCIASSDATHVGMLSCASWAHIMHKCFKLNIPSRTYNATVTHSRKILGTTSGHPATWNDKTLVLFDPLIYNVNNGVIPDNFEFMLYERNNEGIIVEVTYKGVWFMVDNGYLAWSSTIPPMKHAVIYKCIPFSEWLESMRKYVECTFGIMKG